MREGVAKTIRYAVNLSEPQFTLGTEHYPDGLASASPVYVGRAVNDDHSTRGFQRPILHPLGREGNSGGGIAPYWIITNRNNSVREQIMKRTGEGGRG